MQQYSNLFLIVSILILPNFLWANHIKDDEKLVIEKMVQEIEFSLGSDNALKAKLTCSFLIKSKTSLEYNYSKSIFFDNTTSVNKIQKKVNGKKIKIQPIIADYESDGIFHSDLKRSIINHNFNAEGERVVISYEKKFEDYRFLDPFYFNDVYSVKESVIEIKVPEWLSLDIKEWNFDKERPTYLKSNEKGKIIHKYTLFDLPAAFQASGEPRRNKVNAHLILIPKEINKGNKKIRLMKDTGDLYAWYSSLVKEIGNDNKNLTELVKGLTKDETTDEGKVKSIFYWVQDNIRYIAFEYGIMGFRPDNCQNVYNNKYGDCKGMANLTKEMLTIAGFDARLTWIGTRDLPYTYDLPSLIVDNHMICTVILEGKNIFLDATEKYADLYDYGYRIQGKQAMIENGADYIIATVPDYGHKVNKEQKRHELSVSGEQLTGKGVSVFSGDQKTYLLNYLASAPQNEWDKIVKAKLANYDKNIKLDLKSTPSLENRGKDVEMGYDVVVNNHVINLGDELYVNPETSFDFQDYEIPSDRETAYDYSETYFIDSETTLNIPEGWKVQYLPEAIAVDNDKYAFRLSYQAESNKIVYKKSIEIKDPLVEVSDFGNWNSAIGKLKNFYSDQIIFSKK